MKKLLLPLVCALASLIGFAPLVAQTESIISITPTEKNISEDKPFNLSISFEGEGDIILEGTPDNYSKNKNTYTLTSDKLVIKGKVTRIDGNYSSTIETIDCTQSTTIERVSAKYGALKQLLIAGCPSIKKIEVPAAGLTSLDVSNCTQLKELYASGNMHLTSVALNGCTALEEAELQNCAIESIDLSGLSNITTLSLQRNPFTSISFSGLTKITTLDCSETEITSLDLSECTQLNILTASSNKNLTDLKLPKAENLQYLYLQGNALEKISLSGLSALQQAYLERNKLTEVEVANCPKLKTLGLHLNALTEEASEKIADQLPDYRSVEGTQPKLFTNGVKIDYTEANKWSAKAVALANKKGWQLQFKNENSYEPPTPSYTFAKVTLVTPTNGTLAIKDFATEDLDALPESFEYTIVATPQEGYKLEKVTLDGEDLTDDLTFELLGDVEIAATFVADAPIKEGYDYYLTSVSATKKNAQLKSYSYGYDENKRWISRTERDMEGKMTLKNNLRYNEKNQISEIDFTLSKDIDKDGKPSQTAKYTYDEGGKIVTRKMYLYGQPLADCYLVYRPDGQIDYWYDKIAGIATNFLYNEKNQLVEEHFGEGEGENGKPTIESPIGKLLYSYNAEGKLALQRTSARANNWQYISGQSYTWEGNRLQKLTALNYEYAAGATDPESGQEKGIFELRYNYEETTSPVKIFWPRLPMTENNGGLFEFSYLLEDYCTKAEYWSISGSAPKHFLDFIYTFEASPTQVEKLIQQGTPIVRYEHGMIVVEGASLYGITVFDLRGHVCLDYRADGCQRVDLGVGSLPSGLYLVQVLTAEGSTTAKLLIP